MIKSLSITEIVIFTEFINSLFYENATKKRSNKNTWWLEGKNTQIAIASGSLSQELFIISKKKNVFA